MKHAVLLLSALLAVNEAPAGGADQLEARYRLPPGSDPGAVILLQGAANGAGFAPNSHTLPAAAAPAPAPEPMPLHVNLLATASVHPFGLDERVRVDHGAGKLRVTCGAGTRPAGVLVKGPWYLPRAQLAVQVRFSGESAFRMQVADARSASQETAHDLGELPGADRSREFALPDALDRRTWRQFLVQCPPGAGSLTLDSLALLPRPVATGRRATWIWDARQWQRDATALLGWAAGEGIGELFIVVPLAGHRVAAPASLAAFVERAQRAGIAVSAVEGDPHMVLPQQHGATLARARAYAAYNAGAAPAARLRALQFDIEPYLLPAGTLDPAEMDRHYLSLAGALRRAASKLALEFVVPYWWSEKTALLDALAQVADGLAVMDYRTAPDEIVRFGVPFLDWATRHGKRVHIALEAGPVAPELQRRYVRVAPGAPGRLALVEEDGRQALLLLRKPAIVPGAVMFRLDGERLFDGSATSFHGDKARLRALLPGLERDLSAWPGFAGLALHGWR